MAINLKFDLLGNPELPSIVLANRNGNKLGQLNVNVESIDVSDKFNAASEFSFTLNKYIDGEPTPLWDKVKDFKLVYCPEWDLWFETKVELDEATETVKTVFCTQLGQAELSQIKIYNIHINEEGDPNWDTNNETYKSTILYDKDNEDISLLHRLLKDKAPHYSIAYVDESIQRIQKTFSFDNTSICEAFNEIAEEIGCLFVYNSNTQAGGKPNRTISVYDLQQKCNDCGHRGEFTEKCPKCESTNIKYGYGEDTAIFVTSDELATEGISLTTDTDLVKNCFKLEGGDELMTATIRNCNPNGSDYIWYFSESMKEDMSTELVEKIESYDEKYKEYYNNHISELNLELVNQYNALVEKYKEYYDTQSTCLDCNTNGDFEEQCSNPECNSKNILNGKKLQTMPTTITGYPALMTAYYNTIDLLLYLESSLMPNVQMSDTSAAEQIGLLTASSLSPVAVNVKDIANASEPTAKSAVLSMAKVLVKPTYKVDIADNSSSLSETVYTDDDIGEYKVWTGKFVVTNYSDEEDSATSDTITVRVNNATETFIKQKIEKALNKEDTDDYSITGLFAKEYDEFCEELTKYALNPLDNFSKACDDCLSILHEQGVGDDGSSDDNEVESAKKKALYDNLYKPFFDKQQAINDEMAIRRNEIAIIEGVWDLSDEDNPECTTLGLQQYIEECQQDIQDELDFENHLGENLWLEFCAYRREDKYSNSNYISDGLNNAELFQKANEFIEVAEEEIFKSAELQHSISATLNNLLSLPKFKPLLKSFKTGNWIRVQVDDKVYRLRLLEYNFNYGDLESIPVEFSDVTKIKNGTTDVQDVFEQAASMASSYDAVQRQAKKGDVARSTIDQWLVDGLDSADVQIKSNDSEEILLTKNGLMARSYDDITGTYAPEQFKLTHNIMAYTDDNWETVSSALGKHNYKKWEDDTWITNTDYGLSAKFVTAGYITGSQIIGGEIVSSNYNPTQTEDNDRKGTYINLLNGDFDFGGGKIVYKATDNNVILKGVTIQWDGEEAVNPPAVQVQDITGLSDEIEKIATMSSALSSMSSALGSTIIDGQHVISPYIVGGYLHIKTDDNKNGVIIDPKGFVNEDYIFRVYNDDTTAIGLDVNGNAEFSGTINGSQIIGGDLLIGDKENNGDYAEITNDGKLTCTNVDIQGGTLKIGGEKDEDGNPIVHTWISTDGALNTYDANISGTIYAGAGSIGGFTIEPIKDEDGDTIGGWLYSSDKTLGDNSSIFLSATDMSGKVGETTLDDWRLAIGENFGVASDGTAYMSNCEITGGSLRMGNMEDGYSAWISVDEGVLKANGANISGTINAVDGSIGGWKITNNAIYKEQTGSSSGMYAASENNLTKDFEFELNDDGLGYTVKKYIGTDRVVYIPHEYEGMPVTCIGDGVWNIIGSHDNYCDGIDEIVIPDSVKIINNYAFYKFSSLTSIVGAYNVTSIGNYAFCECMGLYGIHIKNNVEYIGEYAFGECHNLKSVTIPNSVTDIKNDAFSLQSHGNMDEYWIHCECEETQKPDGWEYDWNSSGRMVEWGYNYSDLRYNCQSLVDSQMISFPRFFAGSKLSMPTSVDDAKFLVLEDGSFYASAANISGKISASEGNIGNLAIQGGGLQYVKDSLCYSLDKTGLMLNKNDAKIRVGDLSLGYDSSEQGTIINTTGNFIIRGANGTQIELMRNVDNKTSSDVYLWFQHSYDSNSFGYSYADVWITSDSPTFYETTFNISWQSLSNIFGSASASGVVSVTMPAGSKESPKVEFHYEMSRRGVQFMQSNGTWSDATNSRDALKIGIIGDFYQTASPQQLYITGNLIPSNNTYNLGGSESNQFWNNIYCNTSAIDLSDKNQKNTIRSLSDSHTMLFDSLKPVSYKFNINSNNRTHIGLIAQDVKDAIENAGLNTQDFGGYCEWTNQDGSIGCGLRYSEFISLCIDQIQKLKKRVKELESK